MALFLPTGAKPRESTDTGHWYGRDGSPQYRQQTAGGNWRGTDLRDARKFGLVPSVTTALSVVAKPALETWKVKQGILAALTLPRNPDESDDAYLARVLEDSKQQAKMAAEEGTRIHDAIECHFTGQPYDSHYEPHVEAVLRKLDELFPGVNDWIVELSFASELGYGGKVDIHSASTGLTGDHKGKDGDFTDGKRLAYDQHWQLAAYQRGLKLPRAPGFNLFLSRTHPGKIAHHIWEEADMDAGWAVFEAALELWKRIKGYDPSFTRESAAA